MILLLFQNGNCCIFLVLQLLHEPGKHLVIRFLGRRLVAIQLLNAESKQLGYRILDLVCDVEVHVRLHLVGTHKVDVLNPIALLGLVLVLRSVDVLKPIPDLRCRAGITSLHSVRQNTVGGKCCPALVVFGHCRVVVSQRLADNKLLQGNLVLQEIHQLILDKSLSLVDVALLQQNIQCSTKDVLHNRCIVTALEHDTHRYALCLYRIRILLILHSDVALATEEDEWIERLLVGDLVGLSHLSTDASSAVDTHSDGLGNVLGGELNEDRICVPVDNISTELTFGDSSGELESSAPSSGCASCDVHVSDGRGPSPCLSINGVCNHLVSKLSAVKHRSLSFIIL